MMGFAFTTRALRRDVIMRRVKCSHRRVLRGKLLRSLTWLFLYADKMCPSPISRTSAFHSRIILHEGLKEKARDNI